MLTTMILVVIGQFAVSCLILAGLAAFKKKTLSMRIYSMWMWVQFVVCGMLYIPIAQVLALEFVFLAHLFFNITAALFVVSLGLEPSPDTIRVVRIWLVVVLAGFVFVPAVMKYWHIDKAMGFELRMPRTTFIHAMRRQNDALDPREVLTPVLNTIESATHRITSSRQTPPSQKTPTPEEQQTSDNVKRIVEEYF